METNNLISLDSLQDLPAKYHGTPIADLVEYQNFNAAPKKEYDQAELLAIMCMDHRKSLQVPKNFCYIMRDGGANMKNSMFKVSFALSVGGVKYIAIIGHNHCGMVNLLSNKSIFIQGLVDAGWEPDKAIKHFELQAPQFEIGNEVSFTKSEAKRLREEYPNVTVVPFLYKLEDSKFYLIEE